MKIEYNQTFERLLKEYNLPLNLKLNIEPPKEILNILNSPITIKEDIISLDIFEPEYYPENLETSKSIIEDNQNHFHVDMFSDDKDCKQAFQLGIFTLNSLAEKFIQQNHSGIKFTYSFQTPQMSKEWEMKHGFYQQGDEEYISDRLSFYKLRVDNSLTTKSDVNDEFWALLEITI